MIIQFTDVLHYILGPYRLMFKVRQKLESFKLEKALQFKPLGLNLISFFHLSWNETHMSVDLMKTTII